MYTTSCVLHNTHYILHSVCCNSYTTYTQYTKPCTILKTLYYNMYCIMCIIHNVSCIYSIIRTLTSLFFQKVCFNNRFNFEE